MVSSLFQIVCDEIMNDDEVVSIQAPACWSDCIEDSQRRGWLLSTFKTFECAVQTQYDVFDFNFDLNVLIEI